MPEFEVSPSEVGRPLTDPALIDARRQFVDIIRDGTSLLEGLDDRQLAWSPQAGRWSVGKCLDHLNASVSQYLPFLDQAIERAQSSARVSDSPFRSGFLFRRLLRWMEPPVRSRAKAPQPFSPGDVLPPKEELLERFTSLRQTMIEQIHRADGLDLSRTKVISPVSRLLKIRLGNVFPFLAAHDRRHLWQARRVMDLPGYGDL